MTPQQFAQAIAQVESGNVSNPPMGDGGRATGRYQMHPDWVWQWATTLRVSPELDELWDMFFMRLIQAYFAKRTEQGLTPVQAAVSYHVGHIAKESDPTWDQDYADRFNAAAGTLS